MKREPETHELINQLREINDNPRIKFPLNSRSLYETIKIN